MASKQLEQQIEQEAIREADAIAKQQELTNQRQWKNDMKHCHSHKRLKG